MQPTDNIIFETRDLEIFNIPDTKTKLNTLQNYFFPRLQRVLSVALTLVREVYGIDPFEKYSFVYHPSHRRDAKVNADISEIFLGISGRRDVNRQLKIKRPDGKYYSFHPAHLYFKILPTGELNVELFPFGRQVDSTHIQSVKRFLAENYSTFSIILNSGRLLYEGNDDFSPVIDQLNNEYSFLLSSPNHYLPIENQAAIYELTLSFVMLFPVLDACYDIAEGTTPVLKIHFDKLKLWLSTTEDQDYEEVDRSRVIPQLPELDSYKFVRAGLWWQILSRDNWTCCSCKRSSQKDGIVLHVDHILPRSLGGKDESKNLQTLCEKCNIGKSNKDTTDLRG